MDLRNSTSMDTARLRSLLEQAVAGWPRWDLHVLVRYSRGADFSGICEYGRRQIRINIGRHVRYPYTLQTAIARPQTNHRYWWRELYSIEIKDAYQLVLFIFLHEFYHWLVKKARRNVRQKEGRCDRFATRALVDGCGAVVRDARGQPAPRDDWDFQDLDGFVAAARGPRHPAPVRAARKAVGQVPAIRKADPSPAPVRFEQLMLFSV